MHLTLQLPRPLKLWAGVFEGSNPETTWLWSALCEKEKILSFQKIIFSKKTLSENLKLLTRKNWESLGSPSLNQLLGREPQYKIIARLTHSAEIRDLKSFDEQKFIQVPKNVNAIDLFSHEKFFDVARNENFAPQKSLAQFQKPKLLVHVCCGPDAAGVIEQLKQDFEIEMFWYDPNIQPQEEHDLRLAAFEKVCKITNTPYTVGEYDVENFEKSIEGLELTPEQGAKCSNCYDMRLERAAREAKTRGFDAYTTTLAISPHKVQRKLEAFGALNEKKYGIPYYARNFMKHEGFKESVDFTRKHEIFRQDYCGCVYSLWEGGPTARAKAELLGIPKPPHLNSNLNFYPKG